MGFQKFFLPLGALIFFKGQPLWAEQKPVCNVDHVTRKCEFFKEKSDQAFISLPDGTAYPNPLYQAKEETVQKEAGQKSASYGDKLDPALEAIVLEDQADILDQLQGSGFSTRFIISFAAQAIPRNLIAAENFQIPWPPDQKKSPQMVTINRADVFSAVENRIGKAKFKRLQAIVQKNRSEIEKRKLISDRQEADRAAENEKRIQKEESEANDDWDRLKGLMNEAKEHMKAVLASSSMKDEDRKILIEKIEAVQLASLPEALNLPQCAKGATNGFYESSGETIYICPALRKWPDAALISLFGHELGHSIDACYSRMERWKINQDQLLAAIRNDTFSKKAKDEILTLLQQDTRTMNDDLAFLFPDTGDRLNLVRVGAFSPISKGVAAYPFQEEYNCLVKQDRFFEVNESDIQQAAQFYERRLREASPSQHSEIPKIVREYKEALRKYPQCLSVHTHTSQMKEVSSDMMGALVLERHLKKNPPKTEAQKVGISLFISLSCTPGHSLNLKEQNFDWKSSIKHVNFIKKNQHPITSLRLSKTLFNLPSFEKMFDCVREEVGCFDHLSLQGKKTQATKEGAQ